MIPFKIKFVFVVMGFDLLLMLIINLTVFLIISVRVVVFVKCAREEREIRKKRKECEYRCLKKYIFLHAHTYTRNRFFNADGTTTFILYFHFILFIFLFHFFIYIFNLQ